MPLIYLDQIADKKLKASSTDDADTGLLAHIYSTSIASIRTAGGLSIEKRLAVGQFDGRVPLGATISITGTYGNGTNGGGFTTAPGIPATGVISDDGYMRCDGAQITDPSAVLSGFVPKIDDDRFLQGSSSAGLISVANTANLNNNFVQLASTTYLPPHSHSMQSAGFHAHQQGGTPILDFGFGPGDISIPDWQGAGRPFSAALGMRDNGGNGARITGGGAPFLQMAVGANTSSVSPDGSHSHSIDSNGSGAVFDIRPRWISVIYLIRVR
jgi:hypothetical protein